ncbi:MAG TPA: serine/threonine-protein kinase [Polyangiaceae bacterium]|nr:serine/threonine-protein kinase [Polyangiaceae bacterium]
MLGRYELLLPLATGGMAMVWAARVKGTRGFQKIVAVKTMLSKLSEDAQFEQMFLDEASLASQIRHPNVVEISDLGEQEGVLYLAMEWIDGVPLNQLMKTAKAAGGVPLPVAVRIVMNACAGLHAAHELRDSKGHLIGLVHRDVSPQNILVTYDGVSKVVDFGVAKATAMGGSGTVAGQLKGKVSYMAPEQVRGEAIDRRVDVFALGIVLYSLTTGKHPFRRESEAATMYTIASDEPVLPPSKFLPNYPPALEAVLLKALAKDQNDRYATASDFQRALYLCQPPGERTNTDEDVGAFIRQMFGNRRDESRAALAEALAQADKRGRRSQPDNVNPLTQSQRRSLSDVGVSDAALTDESKTFGILGSAQGAALAAAAEPDPLPVPRRKRALLVVSLVGVALLAAAAALALSQSGDEQAPKPHPSATSKPVATATPHADLTAPDPAPMPPAESPSSEAASASARAAAPIVPRASATPRATPLTPATPSAVVKPKPTTPKWREDPGF